MQLNTATYFMGLAIDQAKKAAAMDEVPVGAVIVHQNRVIASSHNLVQHNKNATHHAEMLCIDAACQFFGQKYLMDCDLFVTLEPCPMCAAALAHVKIRRIYFGAYDIKSGGIDHTTHTFQHMCHQPQIYGGISETECQNLLKKYFLEKR
ncbi:MAG: nucleoside deaminase [Alphaproteobacteria bacterium]|nr:nucleoside deaminase [Alphaproteobacteria bacterium]